MWEKIKYVFSNLIKLYVIIFGFTMIATVIFLYLFDSYTITRTFLIREMIFCFLALFPISILFSLPQRILDEHTIALRIFVFLFQVATLLPYGHYIEMWTGFYGGAIMVIITFVLNIATPLVAYGKDALLSNYINKRLADFNKDEE